MHQCICRWLKVVPMVMNTMESSSLNLYGSKVMLPLQFFKSHSCLLIHCFYLFLQNLIDLAGSESSKTETTGLRRKEGSYINKSLLTLGTVGALQYFMRNGTISFPVHHLTIIHIICHLLSLMWHQTLPSHFIKKKKKTLPSHINNYLEMYYGLVAFCK